MELKPQAVRVYKMSFDGQVLERGFWIYVWRIMTPDQVLIYVGRTGDNSSPFASSPFRRIGQHLDFGRNAKANSLTKHLSALRIIPSVCKFEMIALGPFFPEQPTWKRHRLCRDAIAGVEFHVAARLKSHGFNVLGRATTRKTCEQSLLAAADEFIRGFLTGQGPLPS